MKELENSFRGEMKKAQAIMELQKKYENGQILEAEMTDSQKEELKELYRKQIETLKQEIIVYKKSMQEYKNKIIAVREKLKNKI